MPAGLPTKEALTSRQVGAFALDTSILQAASFRFEDGQLRHLSGQLPPWLKLWMPGIVAREVTQHRMDAVRRAVQQVGTARSDLTRFLMGAELPAIDDSHDYVQLAVSHFDRQLRDFIAAHSGELVEIGQSPIAQEMFDRYFSQLPPFGGGKDKKHEFPDAAVLLLLEGHARRRGVQVLTVSGDAGWARFAATSDVVFCVPTLSDLTGLFEARSAKVLEFKARLVSYLASRHLTQAVRSLLNRKLVTLPWLFRTSPVGRYDVETQLTNAVLRDFVVQAESLRVWTTSTDGTACVAQVAIDVEVALEIDAYAHRYKHRFPGEEEDARVHLVVDHRFEATIALEFVGLLGQVHPESALQGLSLLENPVFVNIGRVQFAGFPTSSVGFDDMNDVPF